MSSVKKKSAPLGLGALGSFKPNVVNMQKEELQSAKEDFERQKNQINVKEAVESKKNSQRQIKKGTKSKESENLEELKAKYEQEIAELKIQIAESQNNTLTKNEESLLNAIRSEILNQSTNEPIISRSILIKKYKMNSKYLDSSIKGLENKEIIQRKQVAYSAKIMTNSWKIL